jgi:MFS family permease
LRKIRPVANLALLLLGSAVSTFGNALVLVALLIHLAGFADSARLIGLVQGSAYLPMALFSYAAGAWADRHSPKSIMIWTDALRGLAMVAGGIALEAAPGLGAGMAVLLPLVFIMGTLQSLFIPGVVLLCVDMEGQLATRGRRVRVLGLRNAGSHGATLAGNAVGGSLYLLAGLPTLLVFSGLGFILSALSEIFLKESPRGGTDPELLAPRKVSGSHRAPAAALLADFRAVLRTPPVDLYLLVQMVIPLLTMVLPSFLTEVLGLPAQALGLVFALLLAGSIMAGLSPGFRAARRPAAAESGTVPRRPCAGHGAVARAYLPGLLSGLLLAAIALPGKALPLPLAAALLVGLGHCLGSLYLGSIESVQNISLPGRGGRGHGMLESLSSIVTPVSYFLGAAALGSGVLARWMPSAAVFIALLAGILIAYALVSSSKLVSRRYTSL